MVELLVSTTIGGLVLVGVLTMFLLIARTAANLRNYSDIEIAAREALEVMSREIRSAYDVTTMGASTLTLAVPDNSATRNAHGYSVTYTFNATAGTITRDGPPLYDTTLASSPAVLLTGVEKISASDDVFNYYRYVNSSTLGAGYVDGFATNTAPSARAVQQIEMKFQLSRKSTTVRAATNKVLSARFIIRNK